MALVRFVGNTCRSKVDPQHSLRLICLPELLNDATLISSSFFIFVVLQEEVRYVAGCGRRPAEDGVFISPAKYSKSSSSKKDACIIFNDG